MAKRLKTVFANHDACAHQWASQTQEYGRSGPMYFQGASLFSYGSHFEIARIVEHRGVKVALFNNVRYSNTTAKHQAAARRACCHMLRLYSDGISTVAKALTQQRDKILADAKSTLKQRRPYNAALEYLDERVARHNNECAGLGCKRLRTKLPAKLRAQIRDHVIKRTLRNDELSASRNKRLEEKAKQDRLTAQLELIAWRQGGPRTARVTALRPQSIRVRGAVVQTSGGAEVLLHEATQLLARVEAGIAKEGDSVGSFTFNGIEDGFALIGCHRISIEEAKQVLVGRSLQLLKGGR